MKFRVALSALSLATVAAVAAPAVAHEIKNLKVISKDTKEKDLEKAMKDFTKGLGVKCEACHVKGKFDSDDVKAKISSREFLDKVIGNKDEAVRKAALADMLKAMDLKAVKDEALIWKGIDAFKK